jgi:CubicO group peptidase (beta-lactamase class C family)
VQYIATVETEPPHRLTGLRGLPTGRRLRDPRTAGDAPQRTRGNVPGGVPAIAAQALADLGLPNLLQAGGAPGNPETKENWVLARGWADLDRREPLDPGHRFPAPGVTALVTTTAVLRLVAEARIGLDDRANNHLTTVQLADDTITVRELLTHTAGVDDPTEMYAQAAPENLAALMGPVIGCGGPRGVTRPSNGGIAVLGQLIADVTALPYPDAAKRMVLDPLGLRDSSFPARPADVGPGAVTSYNLTLQGMFEPIPALVSTLQAVAGLWSTGADLVRLGLGWSSLLPGSLAHEALTPQPLTPQPLSPQADPTASGQRPGAGLGWLIGPRGDIAAHAGAGMEGTADLTIRIRDNRTHVVLTSRFIPINSIDVALLQAWTNPT